MFVGKKTPEQISYNMKQVKSKGSKIEVMLMKELWSRGLRYRKNVKSVYGKPDIAFICKKVAVFCDSEFWHGYNWEERKHDFKSNQEFWISKIERNIERDLEVTAKLELDGWTVLRFWEIIWANDIDKFACVTYLNNFADTDIVCADISQISAERIPKADVLVAGFPCQSFSLMGYQRGFKDPRGNLFFEIARVADAIKPKVP